MTDLTFDDVTKAWDDAGERPIHPLDPDGEEFWTLGESQAAQVREYVRPRTNAEPGLDPWVMDFGCGNGRLTAPLVQAGYNVLAVDASQKMLDALRKRSAERGTNAGKATLMLSDSSDFEEKLDADFFDVVISRAVLIHHSHADVEKILRQLVRVLKPGGHLIADWPLAAGDKPHERESWTHVTSWAVEQRRSVADRLGLEEVLMMSSQPGFTGAPVWKKAE